MDITTEILNFLLKNIFSISGFVSGMIGLIFAPWANFEVKKSKEMRGERKLRLSKFFE